MTAGGPRWVPLPPIEVLVAQLQFALEEIRLLLPPDSNRFERGLHTFIQEIQYDGKPLNSLIIVHFLKNLNLIELVQGTPPIWEVAREGGVAEKDVRELIVSDNLPRRRRSTPGPTPPERAD